MPSAVFDTVVFVRALINPFRRWGDLVFRYYSRCTLVTAQPLIIEILDVLARPEVNRKFRVFPGLDVPRLLELVGEATLVELEDVPLASRDPKDDKFLATAMAGNAEYVVSEDQDLLVLGVYEGVQIVDSPRFLRILEEGESDLGS
jgi:uncharacterized protein